MAMADYLPTKTADYILESLSIVPQIELSYSNKKIQDIHEADDGSILVSSYSDNVFFDISLTWEYVTIADADFIISLWTDTTKCNGSEKTFYWVHPTDGFTYVARFMSKPTSKQTGNIASFRGISGVTLRIEGVQ